MRTISNRELAEKYGQYCGYWAQHFLKREKVPFQQADAEDLASRAHIQLMKCPRQFRNQKNYVTRLIINAVLDGLRRERRIILAHEYQPPHMSTRGSTSAHDSHIDTDWFDTLEGRDGLAEAVQVSCDGEKVRAVFYGLNSSDRIVLQLAFGLTGLRPLSCERIGSKLGRTPDWAERRMRNGINQIRERLRLA